MATTTKRRTNEAWEFLWCRESDDPAREDTIWKSRTYRTKTLKAACDKMVRFLNSRGEGVYVDYEACAEHIVVKYNPDKHEESYPDLSSLDHPIRDYVW